VLRRTGNRKTCGGGGGSGGVFLGNGLFRKITVLVTNFQFFSSPFPSEYSSLRCVFRRKLSLLNTGVLPPQDVSNSSLKGRTIGRRMAHACSGPVTRPKPTQSSRHGVRYANGGENRESNLRALQMRKDKLKKEKAKIFLWLNNYFQSMVSNV